MWKLILFSLLLIVTVMSTDAGTPYKSKRKRQTGNYASAGGYAGAGGNGGYTGGYVGNYNGDYDSGSFYGDYAPNFGAGFIDPYLFHQQLTAQILAQHAAQTNAIITTSSTGNGQAWGSASVMPDSMTQYMPANLMPPPPEYDAIQSQIANQAYYNSQPHRYAPNYAAASGSIGPGGYYQSAYVNPAGSTPNIVNRFGESSDPGGYKGVSVSSFSSSSDINGKRTNHRGAQTTINDNGKITTYHVNS